MTGPRVSKLNIAGLRYLMTVTCPAEHDREILHCLAAAEGSGWQLEQFQKPLAILPDLTHYEMSWRRKWTDRSAFCGKSGARPGLREAIPAREFDAMRLI